MHAVKKAFCRIPFNPRQKCRIETCWSDFLYLFLCSFGLYPLDGDKYFAADVRAPHSLISLDQCKQKHCKSPCFVLWPPDLCVLIFHLFISSHVKQKVRQRNTGIFFANIYHASLSSRQWVCWLVLHFFFFLPLWRSSREHECTWNMHMIELCWVLKMSFHFCFSVQFKR